MKEDRELLDLACRARENAYAPYSHFAVGAALLCGDGTIYTGCNIENAAYPAGICAERTAAAKAISEGRRDFVALAIAGSSQEPCLPCGICRQFLYEFAPDLKILCCGTGTAQACYTLRELLPGGFNAASM